MEGNATFFTAIVLLGLQLPQNITVLVFCILLLTSALTICGNLLIITAVSYSKTLHCPMYFFLSQLSVLDILLVMDIIPNMLHTVLSKEAIISFSACIAQFYFFSLSEGVEMFLLAVMSYDRYVAICKPLHYTLIMTHQVCWRMVFTCWILDIIITLNTILTILKLQCCCQNVIDHFFCDFGPILELSCMDTSMVQLEINLISVVCIAMPFLLIIVSYIYIIVTISKIPSITGRKKAFSTCSSHLTVVSLYYETLAAVYFVSHRGQLQNTARFLSLQYTVITPLINPIIYSLRNNDLKNALRKLINSLPSITFNH